MGDGEVFGVIGGEQVQGLLVAVQGGVEVAQEHRLRLRRRRGPRRTAQAATVASDPRILARPSRSCSALRSRLCWYQRSAWSRSRRPGTSV